MIKLNRGWFEKNTIHSIKIVACLSLFACAHNYPNTYDTDSMLIDPDDPTLAHLYDVHGRYMATGAFVDSCTEKEILSQSPEELAKCRFKTDVSIYPSGIVAIQDKVKKVRSLNNIATVTPSNVKIAENKYTPLSTSNSVFIPSSKEPRRLALVIGNSFYHSLPQLYNPGNDAELIAKTLTEVGFELVKGKALLDLDKNGFENAIKDFSQELNKENLKTNPGGVTELNAQGDKPNKLVALFYYAGHGLQIRGENYLIPTDANPTKESDADLQLINANVILRQMESASTNLNIVVLDACRNNPMGGRGLRSSSNGLAEMRAPEGTIIAFATQNGNVAQDGKIGGNSPFAQALAWGIKQPGLDQFGTFNSVAVQVKKTTNGDQLPWMSNSPIEGQFYFMPKSTP